MSDTQKKVFELWMKNIDGLQAIADAWDDAVAIAYSNGACCVKDTQRVVGNLEKQLADKDADVAEAIKEGDIAIEARDEVIKDLQVQLAEAQQQGEPYAAYFDASCDVPWRLVNKHSGSTVLAYKDKTAAIAVRGKKNAEWRAAHPVKRYVKEILRYNKEAKSRTEHRIKDTATGEYTLIPLCKTCNPYYLIEGEDIRPIKRLDSIIAKLNAQHDAEVAEQDKPKWVPVTEPTDNHYVLIKQTPGVNNYYTKQKLADLLNKLEREQGDD